MDHNFIVVNIIRIAQEIYFHDLDEDEEQNENILEKVDNYAETTVPNMTDRQFQMHFRMSPETFEDLLNKLNYVKLLQNKTNIGNPSISLEKEAMIVIWCLGNIESFRSVADRFGISKSTCWSALYRTCYLLLKVNKFYKIISWPSRDRDLQIIREFSFPGVIGAIDGSHIRIVAPKRNHNSYINRKGYHSILLQGVCDNNKLFTDVYTGEAGSIHDLNLFKRSDLYNRMINNEIVFPNDSHLIGDLAYTLNERVLVGFKNYGNLTIRQKNFNLLLNKSRVVIDNAFALLKGRFRRLKFMETVRLDLISLLIISACILHNVCLLKGNVLEDIDMQQEILDELRNHPNNILDLDIEDDAAYQNAILKRNNIVNTLSVIINE